MKRKLWLRDKTTEFVRTGIHATAKPCFLCRYAITWSSTLYKHSLGIGVLSTIGRRLRQWYVQGQPLGTWCCRATYCHIPGLA